VADEVAVTYRVEGNRLRATAIKRNYEVALHRSRDGLAEQIVLALRQAESGTPVGEICRTLGVSE
jgi:hypothetical protein